MYVYIHLLCIPRRNIEVVKQTITVRVHLYRMYTVNEVTVQERYGGLITCDLFITWPPSAENIKCLHGIQWYILVPLFFSCKQILTPSIFTVSHSCPSLSQSARTPTFLVHGCFFSIKKKLSRELLCDVSWKYSAACMG